MMNFTSIVNQLAKNGKIVSQVQAKLQPVIAKATGTAATILPQSAFRLKEGVDVLNAGKTVVTAIVNDVAAGHSISALAKTTADFDTNWDKFAKEVEDVFNATSLQGQGKVLETFAKTEFGPNVFYAGSAIKNETPNILGGISDFQNAVKGFEGSYRDPVAAAKKIKNGVDGIVNATERVANSLNQMVKIYKGQGNPGNIAGYPLLNQISNLHNNKLLQFVENAMRIGGGVAAVGVGGMNVAADLKKGDFVQASKDAKQTFDNFKSLTKNNMGSGTTPKVQNAVPSSSTSTAPGTTASPFVSTVSQQNTPSTSQTPSASMGGISSSAPTPSPSAVATPSSSTLSSSLNSTSKASDASSSASFENGSSPSSTNQSISTPGNANDNQIGSLNRQQQNRNNKKENQHDDNDDDGRFSNANSNSYVCSGARIKCTFGTSESQLVVYPDRTVFLTGKPMANIRDHQSMYNIKPFGRCRTVAYPPTGSATAAHHGHLTPMPCVPGTYIKWMIGKNDYIVKGDPALLKTSFCQCCYGGIITIINDGQKGEGTQWITKSQKEGFDKDQSNTEGIDVNSVLDGIQLALDAAGFVPGFGAIPDLTNAAISALRGNWAEAGMSVLAAVPVIGDAATATKLAQKGLKAAKTTNKGGRIVTTLSKEEKRAIAKKFISKDVSKEALLHEKGVTIENVDEVFRQVKIERKREAISFYKENMKAEKESKNLITKYSDEAFEKAKKEMKTQNEIEATAQKIKENRKTIVNEINGIDFNKPVERVNIKDGDVFYQYSHGDLLDNNVNIGSFATDNACFTPSQLGISEVGRNGIKNQYELTVRNVGEKGIPALKSTSKAVEDTWSLKLFRPNEINGNPSISVPVHTTGGGTQFKIPGMNKKYVDIRQVNIIR